ncbi:glucosylceramidase [Mucilaginibacter robiniae]|uniref:Glucosylceramidase n=1 Tax=Mucilaginibacter robiniae TaxID=2728022 RepID=A0A7L5DWP2_9SPHI|nr:glycoside hydrolase family 30 beta sandwich domain-containing protein [Mucilaginibacter robiniae]QJD95512.1 glucosylceramidase [Mucilaginibacter robiniae]
MKIKNLKYLGFIGCLTVLLGAGISCKKGSSTDTTPTTGAGNGTSTVTPVKTDVNMWLTQSDQTILFQKQNISLLFGTTTNSNPTIEVDTTQTYQPIDGFGFTLTGGSASLINSLSSTQQNTLLKELFAADTTNIGISYLRISIGASDLSASVYTYDEITSNATSDLNLQYFSIDKERTDLIPVLKKIIAINPSIKILACPWTAPTWMKTNGLFKGGSLKTEYYDVYAKYFVKYIQAMKAEGITIDAITPQNEPLNEYNNPAMLMQATEQANFIKNNLGPQFKAAGLTTKIIAYDHNTDHTEYPLAIFADAGANAYVDGSAFHLYAGSIDALTSVHNSYPAKNIYFTEQYTASTSNFSGDLQWHVQNLIIGATRNWSRNVLEWNLASDPSYGPHTDGGCSTCKGALTINNGYVRNVSYYIIAHASKFVRPGSVRIGSAIVGNLQNVAFKTPEGKKVLIVLNSGSTSQSFNIKFNNKAVATSLNGGAVATYTW